VLDWTAAEIGKFYQPGKKPVTLRLDSDIIEWLKSYGRGYQTKANRLLRHAMLATAEEKSLADHDSVQADSKSRQRKGKASLIR
jgi:hypothetical protein